MEKSITFSAPFMRYFLPPDTKILCTMIYFRVNKTDIDDQYKLYSRTYAYGSSVIEGGYFTVLFAPFVGAIYFCIIITIASVEGLNIFVLEVFNTFNFFYQILKKEVILVYQIYKCNGSKENE